jgi:c-di-GMP-binding flagellar brake protein YcgR
MRMENNHEQFDDSQYRVHSRGEILSLLRSMMQKNQPLTMTVDQGQDSIMTMILEINDDNNTLLIDAAKNNTANERIAQSRNLHFEALNNNIRITFAVKSASATESDGHSAFVVAIPESIVRLQRRDSFRVMMPITKPLRCIFTVKKPEGDNVSIPTNLKNISIGGVGLVDETKTLDLTKGRIYKNCKLELSETTNITVDLEIRSSQELTLGNGKPVNRFGCAFIGLTRQTEALIQRQITQLERNQNAKVTGMM